METIKTNVVQPKPSILNSEETKPKQLKFIKRPEVGILTPPKISTTPVADELYLRQQENPHKVYNLTPKITKIIDIHTISLFAVVGSLIAIILGIGKK
ncbi:hypothetical protein IJ670_04315 [bacterium]|nr:hypothetical protein [bacterium]